MKIWNRVELLLIGVLGVMALTVRTFQVIGRYVNKNFVFIYGEEVVVYLTVWAVFLASSQLVRSDGHVRPDVILRLLPPQGQRWVEAFNCPDGWVQSQMYKQPVTWLTKRTTPISI